MFKSLDTQTLEEIIILDPNWNESTLGKLRTKSRDDHLACPVCKEPVHVRAGKKNRWHFAHKSLSDCPLKHESPNVLQARSLLYKWLKSKYSSRVTIEKHFPETNLPRTLDCYVEVSENKKFGYWILEKGIRSRFPIQSALSDLDLEITWICLSSMLRINEKRLKSVHLTPTERDFSYSSNYNDIYSSYDESLNYFDLDSCSVITLRGLRCVHAPQEYTFSVKLKDDLQEMLISPANGELVHKAEHQKLQEHYAAIQQEQQRQEEERQQQFERQNWLNEQIRKEAYKSKAPLYTAPIGTTSNQQEHVEKPTATISSDYGEQYPCSVCGAITSNWTTLDLGTNTCVCSRECLRKRQEKRFQ